MSSNPKFLIGTEGLSLAAVGVKATDGGAGPLTFVYPIDMPSQTADEFEQSVALAVVLRLREQLLLDAGFSEAINGGAAVWTVYRVLGPTFVPSMVYVGERTSPALMSLFIQIHDEKQFS
jgi:hypothetical protein